MELLPAAPVGTHAHLANVPGATALLMATVLIVLGLLWAVVLIAHAVARVLLVLDPDFDLFLPVAAGLVIALLFSTAQVQAASTLLNICLRQLLDTNEAIVFLALRCLVNAHFLQARDNKLRLSSPPFYSQAQPPQPHRSLNQRQPLSPLSLLRHKTDQ
jgi:hypothetical protein